MTSPAGPRAALLDYGMGNIHSAAKALERARFRVHLASRPEDVAGDVCVLPGVGHFQRCREALDAHRLSTVVKEWAGEGRPLLAVCIGAQLLLDGSDEAEVPGLGVVSGWARRLEAERVPHMGWSEVHPGPAGDGLVPETERFYFVHSFGLQPADPAAVAATCEVGGGFSAVMASGSVVATQFHPEKSGAAGLALLGRLRDRL